MRRSFFTVVSATAAMILLSVGCGLILDLHEAIPTEGTGGTGGNNTVGTGGVPCDVAQCPAPVPATVCRTAGCNADGTCRFDDVKAGLDCAVDGVAGGKMCNGAGRCVECNDAAADCPPTNDECRTPACTGGACGTMNVAADTTTMAGQIANDCKKQICDGNGGTKIVDDDTDPMDDANDCTTDTCSAGMNVHTNVPPGKTCTQNNGHVCGSGTKVGTCVECLVSADCSDGYSCDTKNDNFVCVQVSCMNGIHDGLETDVDCGGPFCGKCANQEVCAVASDCVSGFCGPTDVCEPCAADGDCASIEYCNNGVCSPDEPDGTPCGSTSMCQSANCVDGFCCDTACSGLCEACSALKKGQGNDGACGPIVVSTDPDDECSTDPVASCDHTGACDGAGACQLYGAGITCVPGSCLSNILQGSSQCDGAGTCNAVGSVDCTPYICAGSTCAATCSSDAQCVPTHYCVSNACTPKKPNGQACTLMNGSECASGNCVDGFCCNTACGAICQACSKAKAGAAGTDGTCTFINGTDPDNECPGNTLCVTGACNKLANGTSCTLNGECLSGFCADGVCCSAACGGVCQACVAGKTGVPNGTCSNIAAATDPDNECPGATICAGGMCIKFPNGASCTLAAECTSSHCVDGVCCNTACSTLCTACVAAKTGGTDGMCSGITPGTDPDTECSIGANVNCVAGNVCGP